tara:strand:+ start:190 stop:402 length:213 start_codon:yes stop_codon:yes gene_type:complete
VASRHGEEEIDIDALIAQAGETIDDRQQKQVNKKRKPKKSKKKKKVASPVQKEKGFGFFSTLPAFPFLST